MARLSLGSQHFHSRERRQQLSPTPPVHPDQNLSEIDDYIAQNKLLAVRNAELILKVADLEARVQQLENENTALRPQHTNEAKADFRVQSVLDQVESLVAERVGDMVRQINEIRVQEGATPSVLLESLTSALSACRPVTSTPKAERDEEEGQLLLWAAIPLEQFEEDTKERSASVASLADLAMIDDLDMETQHNIGTLLLPELSTKVAVFTELSPVKEENEVTEEKKVKANKERKAKEVKVEKKVQRRRRRPLSNVTNKRRALPRKAKTEEVPDDFFDFVDDMEV